MSTTGQRPSVGEIEWQTIALIAFSYSVWAALLVFANSMHPVAWILASALNITLFLSITHEVVHGHPTRDETLNSLLVLLPIGWSFPYERFRDTHLRHHETGDLTDPFDDPESWYLAKYDWLSRTAVTRAVLTFNNTLFGRMLIGPAIGLTRFYISEITTLFTNSRRYILRVWIKHLLLCGLMVGLILALGTTPLWQWLVAIYLGHSVLLVRTFLEHQAAPDHSERTVIIEKACPIALLFLFNNYHFIHHDKPHIPWYQLPGEFKRGKDEYIERNGAYLYRSYAQIFRKYFFRTKEPVKHPFLRLNQAG